MNVRLMSSEPLNGEAVLIPENWATLDDPFEIRAKVQNNNVEFDISPGRYSFFLWCAIRPWQITFNGSDVEVDVGSALYQITLRRDGTPVPLQTITLADDPYTATLTTDRAGRIAMVEDPRQYSIHLPEGVTADIQQMSGLVP